MPEDEKERLILSFEKIKLNENLFSDIVIINKKILLVILKFIIKDIV